MDWLMLTETVNNSIIKYYMKDDIEVLTDDQFQSVKTINHKINVAICILARWEQLTPHKEFVSDAEWKLIRQIEEGG